jgi:hypothetical protein
MNDSRIPFNVTARYPNELAPDETIANLAVKKAEAIYDFCLGKISELQPDGEVEGEE